VYSDIHRSVEDLLKAHGKPEKEVYFDLENSGLILPEALEAMVKAYSEIGIGHPSITHRRGWESYEALYKSSSTIARFIGCKPENIVYTHSGTEANNLAILGLAKGLKSGKRKIAVSSIEHLSVIFPAESLQQYGFKVVKIPVDSEGFLNLDILEKVVDKETLMVSIAPVNHEIGVIQCMDAIVDIVRDRCEDVVIHIDACDTLGRVAVDLGKLGIDLASFSSHKVYGPKGAGILYVKDGIQLEPIIHGQLSTQKLWPGVENIPGIVGFAKAVEVLCSAMDAYAQNMARLRDKLIDNIMGGVDGAILNGPRGSKRSPDNINISFLHCEGEALTVELSLRGVYVSSGSACTSRVLEPSHVLLAIGRRFEEAHGSILMKLHPMHTDSDIEYALKHIIEAVSRIRSISPSMHV